MADLRRIQSKKSPLRIPVAISAAVHLTIVLALAYSPGLGFSLLGHKPIRIDAIWVELPKGSSDDIGLGMKKAAGLPQSTIEEQKRLFQPQEIEQQTLSPKMTTPPMADKTVKGDTAEKVSERPKIDVKTTRRNEPKQSTTNRRMRDALAKIDKQLQGRTVVPEAGQISQNQDGYKYGTGTEPLKVPPSDPEYLKYQAMVRAKIIQEWIVPLKFTEDGGPQFSSRLEVMINTDGDVVSIRWETPSGNQTFDQSAIRAVKKASPFPKPPDRLAWEAYNEGFLVEFDPRMKPKY